MAQANSAWDFYLIVRYLAAPSTDYLHMDGD